MINLIKYFCENQTQNEFNYFYKDILSIEIKNRIKQKEHVLKKNNTFLKFGYTCIDYSVNFLLIVTCYSCIIVLKILPKPIVNYIDDKMPPIF